MEHLPFTHPGLSSISFGWSATSPLIIPVLWASKKPISLAILNAVSDVQFSHQDYGDVYAEKGLRFLIRLNKYQDDYQMLVTKLASRIIQVARDHPLLPSGNLPDIRKVQSAFHVQGSNLTSSCYAGIWSLWPQVAVDTEGHESYQYDFNGTSAATIGVAAVAALLLSKFPGLTRTEVVDILKAGADKIDLTSGQYDTDGHSPISATGE